MCASTLIAIHYSVWVVCLQVVRSYCTASGFTFRPVLSCSRLNFCVTWSEKIKKKKKKEQKNGTKEKWTSERQGVSGVILILIQTAHSRFRDHNRVFASLSARLVRLDSIIALKIDRVLASGSVLRSMFHNKGEIKVRYTCKIGW